MSEVALAVTRVLICENDPIRRSALCDLVDSVPGLQLVGSAGDADAAADQATTTRPDGLPAVDLQELLLDLAHLLADAEARLESAELRPAVIAGLAR